MKAEDHHLIVTMEEGSEAITELITALTQMIQRASKQLRFGHDEVQPGQERANHERLRYEILDVLACIRILQHSKLIESITEADVDAHMQLKQAKINRMLEISRAQGRLDESAARSIELAAAQATAKPRGKPCTCDNCLGSSIPCYIESGGKLGDLWYCRKQAELQSKTSTASEGNKQ